MALLGSGVALIAGPGLLLSGLVAGAAASSSPSVTIPETDEDAVVPSIKPLKISRDLDDLAVRPDGTIVVATESNSRYGEALAMPLATAVRFAPQGQLPTLTLLGATAKAYTTQAAVTETGGIVAWTTRGKTEPVSVLEMSDAGVATAPQQLSAAGRAGWPFDVASGGGASAVFYGESLSDTTPATAFRLAYRGAAATTYTSVDVPVRPELRDLSEAKLAIGPSGDGVIAAWSNERHLASLWRVGRDGTVSREIPIPLKSKGYVDVEVAVGGDGTLAATFGLSDDRRSDQVAIAQVPAASSTLAPLYRVKAVDGSSLSTQGVGLAVSPTGRLLVSFEDRSGAQAIVEGAGPALKTTYVAYVSGSSTKTTWLADGTGVVVFEAAAEYPRKGMELVALRHAPGSAVWEQKPIGPGLTPPTKARSDGRVPPSALSPYVRLTALVPAADDSAALAWELNRDRRRPTTFVARVQP